MIQENKAHQDRELTPDRVFYELGYRVMFKENYENRVKGKGTYADEGNENKGILSILIAIGKNFAEYLYEEEQWLGTQNLEEVMAAVASEEGEDGAYVLDGTNISNKVIFDSLGDLRQKYAPKDENDTYCIRHRKKTKEFIESHFPDDFRYEDGRKIDFGTKTKEAGSLGLLAKEENEKICMVKQTAYDHTGTGKTFISGINGVEREFYLYRPEEDQFNQQFYFDEGIVGIVKTYERVEVCAEGDKRIRLTGKYLVKLAQLRAYSEGRGPEPALYDYNAFKMEEWDMGDVLLGPRQKSMLADVFAPTPIKKIAS